jgi:hypothetical protein
MDIYYKMMKGGDNSVKSVNKKKISYAKVVAEKLSYKNIAKTAGIELEFVENGKNPFLLKYPYSMSREENKITNVLVYNPIYDGLKIQWAKTPTDRGNINPMSHTPNKKKFKYLIDNWDDAIEIIKSYKNKNKVINELSDLETDNIKRLLEDLVSKKLYEERAIILHKWLEKHELDVVNRKYKTRAGSQGTFLTPLYQLWYKLYTKLSKPKKSVKKASVKSVKKEPTEEEIIEVMREKYSELLKEKNKRLKNPNGKKPLWNNNIAQLNNNFNVEYNENYIGSKQLMEKLRKEAIKELKK